MNSHLQTRTLTDALNLVDEVLRSRGSELVHSEQREHLALCFAKVRYPRYFDSWAFTAAEFDNAVKQVAQCAPHLAQKLEEPTHPNDLTVVGNCSLDLRFSPDPNGAKPIALQLCNGNRAKGASVTSSRARLYSNQLVGLPTEDSETVYFYAPESEPQLSAASLARQVFADKGKAIRTGITLQFPVAQTTNLMDNSWVKELVSTCGLYSIKNYVSAGKALVDHHGFFAQETQVVQVEYRITSKKLAEIVIDQPFLVFFADKRGVHAAVWFSWDSFSGSAS